ncbi:MAG: hypothetical protein JKY18_05150 [Flavobacteriales bacterium]|nr:hypothetical protein [Flavobacteriales bacterium]
MKKNDLSIEVNYENPSDPDVWNKLAEQNGNLVQSTHYDKIQAYYNHKPIYFEVKREDSLIGGVKLYYWASRKISFITKPLSQRLTQLGEAIIDGNSNIDQILPFLFEEVRAFVKSSRVASVTISGIYGDKQKLITLSNLNVKSNSFNIASIDLTIAEEELWSNIHVKHRNAINNASKNNLVFIREDNIDAFLRLLHQTYSSQHKSAPNVEYIKHTYNELKDRNLVDLFFVKNGSDYLSGALNERFGNFATYTFAGNEKNNLGSGNFLQWEIMKTYKQLGISKYILGQVAPQKDPGNLKFSEGISRFKRRFGTTEVSTHSQTYILNKLYFKVWKATTSLMTKK